MNENWQGQHVVIMGAARQGLALARYLSRQGARVVITDSRTEQQLKKEIQQHENLPIQWQLGGHPFSLLDQTDLVCVSGGVSLSIPFIQEARSRQIPLTNDSQIFLDQVRCPVVGITGSAGKTTTTSLIGEMAKKSARDSREIWVGGNIGTPLIENVEEIEPNHIVILELSSFQLELMTSSPEVALVTNITPNHLDRHGSLEEYTKAKANILTHQDPTGKAVLNHEDPGSWNLRSLVKVDLISYGIKPLSDRQNFLFLDHDRIIANRNGHEHIMGSTAETLLRGKHNLYNILAACSLAELLKLDPSAVQEVINTFEGVPHRLEWVAEKNSVQWYNDSIATAPERTIAAVESFHEPIVLLLGGKDKNLPWDRLVEIIQHKVDHVIIFGMDGPRIKSAFDSSSPSSRPYSIDVCTDLQEAVNIAHRVATPGDIVLLSPGATSYDQFKDFEERGERFRLWVHQLP